MDAAEKEMKDKEWPGSKRLRAGEKGNERQGCTQPFASLASQRSMTKRRGDQTVSEGNRDEEQRGNGMTWTREQ